MQLDTCDLGTNPATVLKHNSIKSAWKRTGRFTLRRGGDGFPGGLISLRRQFESDRTQQ